MSVNGPARGLRCLAMHMINDQKNQGSPCPDPAIRRARDASWGFRGAACKRGSGGHDDADRTPLTDQPVETLDTVTSDTTVSAMGTVINTTKPPGPPVITSPRWVSQPNADQLARAYPGRAIS